MLAQEVQHHERPHVLTDQHDGQGRMLDDDAAVQLPEIAEAFPPAIPLGEAPELLGTLCRSAVAAMIAGVNGIAGTRQRLGELDIPTGMLEQSVGDSGPLPWARFRAATDRRRAPSRPGAVRGESRAAHRGTGEILRVFSADGPIDGIPRMGGRGVSPGPVRSSHRETIRVRHKAEGCRR